jgi:hypothetical protein
MQKFGSDDITALDADFSAPAKDTGETKGAAMKPVEKWAEQKGYWPQVYPAPQLSIPAGTPAGPMGTVAVSMANVTGPKHNPEYWRFAAARAMHAWPEGWELTEADFDAAVKAATEATGR